MSMEQMSTQITRITDAGEYNKISSRLWTTLKWGRRIYINPSTTIDKILKILYEVFSHSPIPMPHLFDLNIFYHVSKISHRQKFVTKLIKTLTTKLNTSILWSIFLNMHALSLGNDIYLYIEIPLRKRDIVEIYVYNDRMGKMYKMEVTPSEDVDSIVKKIISLLEEIGY